MEGIWSKLKWGLRGRRWWLLLIGLVGFLIGTFGDTVDLESAYGSLIAAAGVGIVASWFAWTLLLGGGQASPVLSRLRLVNLTGGSIDEATTEQSRPQPVPPGEPVGDSKPTIRNVPPGGFDEDVGPGGMFYSSVTGVHTVVRMGGRTLEFDHHIDQNLYPHDEIMVQDLYIARDIETDTITVASVLYHMVDTDYGMPNDSMRSIPFPP
jgi:hypothetical protein